MGGRNRIYPSLGWTGVDGEQIVGKNGSAGVQCGLSLRHLCGCAKDFCLCRVEPGKNVMRGLGDLTPPRGLVYDADVVELYSALSEGGIRRGR